jgi:hypothetical protein
MSTAIRERQKRSHDHQQRLGRPSTTLDLPKPEGLPTEPTAIDPHDESWRPFPYYGERPDDRPTLTGLIKSWLVSVVGRKSRQRSVS